MIIDSDPRLLGKKFTKENWTDCYFSVEDIGFYSCWGYIKDKKTKEIRAVETYSLLEEWEPYTDSIFEFIKRLPGIRNEASEN